MASKATFLVRSAPRPNDNTNTRRAQKNTVFTTHSGNSSGNHKPQRQFVAVTPHLRTRVTQQEADAESLFMTVVATQQEADPVTLTVVATQQEADPVTLTVVATQQEADPVTLTVVATQHETETHPLPLAIVAIFCFFPLGIAAMIKAVKSRDAQLRKDQEAAQTLAEDSRRFSRMSFKLGFFIVCTMSVVVPFAIVFYIATGTN
ncbi:uncharacterized protein LOC101851646 [Aplysia californica]|uniref:Uncharacterized protein LOC101851646 n=1 Tax=Aplysia californica TaxID=6500 RepID=A0ABM0JS83_APLCA|nr:uncharacterized protein LOC101851646 [Aplysia californica]